MQFAFVLLESVEEENCKELCHSNGLLGMEDLSFQMLKTLFEVHDMARNEVGAVYDHEYWRRKIYVAMQMP